jgi:hypothetical protein
MKHLLLPPPQVFLAVAGEFRFPIGEEDMGDLIALRVATVYRKNVRAA